MKKASQVSIYILIGLLIFVFYWKVNKRSSQVLQIRPTLTKNTTPVAQKPTKQIVNKSSSDGTVSFTETIQMTSDGSTRYTFSTPDAKTNAPQILFDVVENPSSSYSIPDNSWSPDNKQFFIIKTSSTGQTYLVFRADGTSYKNSQKSLDVIDFWSKTKYSSKITEATGWGGNDLLILRTQLADGTRGPDFWFVTSSNGFLQLRQL